jgi:DNA-binding NtrC family response regulator
MNQPEVSSLIVSRREGNGARLRPVLETLGSAVFEARNCGEAGRLLSNEPSLHLVLTDCRLPDGNWMDVLDLAARTKEKVHVVVISPAADIRLYVEVMNQGAYDFITENFTVSEVVHVIRLALDSARQGRTKPLAQRPSLARFKRIVAVGAPGVSPESR